MSSHQNKSFLYSGLFQRLLFLLLALLVYRLGSHIPVPGIDSLALQKIFELQEGSILGLFNAFSGGSLSRFSIFTIGIMPYISASIILQLAVYLVPSLEQLKKEGEAGRKKIVQYTRYLTLLIAIVQSFAAAFTLKSMENLVLVSGFLFYVSVVFSLTAGSIFLMWLGEQITERGIGNGTSMLIFAGIVSGFPLAFGKFLELIKLGGINLPTSLFFLVLFIAIFYFIVFFESGQRKILVNYARRQVGSKVFQSPSSYLPLKLNMAGVIPPIFASSILLLFSTLFGSWLGAHYFSLLRGQPLYLLFYAGAIVFFAFFYTSLVFNSKETADGLKKNGAFIPGIRPGEQTAKYIDKTLTHLTLVGALYIAFICILPEIFAYNYNLPFSFGGTSLLIAVLVAIDFMTQLQTYMVSQKYDFVFSNIKPSSLKV